MTLEQHKKTVSLLQELAGATRENLERARLMAMLHMDELKPWVEVYEQYRKIYNGRL